MEAPNKPKANGKGSYRSAYWYYPCMEGTGKKSPHSSIMKNYIMMERLENPSYQRNSVNSCWYKTESTKLHERQKIWDYDYFGRVIILRQDTLILMGKLDFFTFIPLFYKGKKLVVQCVERPDSRMYVKPENCIVISDQLRANKERDSIKWTYTPMGNKRLPRIEAIEQ
ncbi:hypothetical protein OGA32_000121 [Salmonella enterica]|nr:hypothetical protein [Salmonella enterica]